MNTADGCPPINIGEVSGSLLPRVIISILIFVFEDVQCHYCPGQHDNLRMVKTGLGLVPAFLRAKRHRGRKETTGVNDPRVISSNIKRSLHFQLSDEYDSRLTFRSFRSCCSKFWKSFLIASSFFLSLLWKNDRFLISDIFYRIFRLLFEQNWEKNGIDEWVILDRKDNSNKNWMDFNKFWILVLIFNIVRFLTISFVKLEKFR